MNVPNANSQKSETSFFFFKFLATALQSISCVASTMFSSSTNVVTPHSTPNLRDLEWRCKQKNCHSTKTAPSLKKRHQLFGVKVCWWFSGSVPPRSQGRFAPNHGAMIWSVTSQVDVFFSENFQHQKWDAKACQLRCMCFFFSGLFCMVRDHHIKMFGDKMSQLLQSIFQQHERWDMTSLWMCLQYRYTAPIGKWCSLVSYHIYISLSVREVRLHQTMFFAHHFVWGYNSWSPTAVNGQTQTELPFFHCACSVDSAFHGQSQYTTCEKNFPIEVHTIASSRCLDVCF